MADYHEYTDQYKVPVIAKLLHALPHYNITFHKINSTFRPNDEIYLEVSPNEHDLLYEHFNDTLVGNEL